MNEFDTWLRRHQRRQRFAERIGWVLVGVGATILTLVVIAAVTVVAEWLVAL